MQRNTQKLLAVLRQSASTQCKRPIQTSCVRPRSYWAESRAVMTQPISHTSQAHLQTLTSSQPHCESRGVITNQTIVGDHFVEQKFVDCVLRDGIFENCTFERCQMTGGNYHLCHAETTKFLGGSFDCCTLSSSYFVGGDFMRSNLQHCTNTGGTFTHCVQSDGHTLRAMAQ